MNYSKREQQECKINITYGQYDTRWWRFKQIVRWVWTGKAELTDYQ